MIETKKWRLMLVDDHQILLDGIKTLLNAELDLEIVGEASGARTAKQLLGFAQPDLMVTDLSLPDTVHTDFIKEIRSLYPKLKILVLSMHDEQAIIKDVLKAGANGYVLKNNSREELVKAIRNVLMGAAYVSPDVSLRLLEAEQRVHSSHLTEREIEIVRLIANELSNKQIADKLFISERTVESHRKNIFRKAGAHTVVGVVRYAMDHKLL
ncbi:MAG: response regulator transcription factor [Sphingobacteriaceae bacterium]|nr:response regulator transcription factor [Sphingobacteriaceae bacterium]